MENNQSTALYNRQSKGKEFKNQLKTIFHYLKEHVATASMVADETGIPQKNICRYKRDLEICGRLWEVEKKNCKKTGFKAWYLTTDPEKAPSNNQLTMF
jgi:predicted transcriptional regulator